MKQTQDELAAAKQELAKEKENYSTLTIISQQFNQQLEEVRSQLEAERADLQQLQAELERTREELASKCEELATLKQNPPPAAEQNPAPAIDLSEQIPQIINFLKQELPPDTKWPKRVMPKLREFLESKED